MIGKINLSHNLLHSYKKLEDNSFHSYIYTFVGRIDISHIFKTQEIILINFTVTGSCLIFWQMYQNLKNGSIFD